MCGIKTYSSQSKKIDFKIVFKIYKYVLLPRWFMSSSTSKLSFHTTTQLPLQSISAIVRPPPNSNSRMGACKRLSRRVALPVCHGPLVHVAYALSTRNIVSYAKLIVVRIYVERKCQQALPSKAISSKCSDHDINSKLSSRTAPFHPFKAMHQHVRKNCADMRGKTNTPGHQIE